MQIKPEAQADYDKGLEVNQDPYGHRIYTYAQEWADLMGKRIPEGATSPQVMRIIVDHADEDSRTADYDGITGYMYGAAVSVLAHCWVWGEELRRWHNKTVQFGDEGDRANETGGVLNPALLTISLPDDGGEESVEVEATEAVN